MVSEKVLAAARAKGIRIATAESCTGGLIIAALTEIPGASDVIDRGFITYSNAAKIQMLGVDPQTLLSHGAVSEDVAREMAYGALKLSDSRLAVAVTGIAGPGASEHKPEGRVCFAVAMEKAITSETMDFGAVGRNIVREKTVTYALNLMLKTVLS